LAVQIIELKPSIYILFLLNFYFLTRATEQFQKSGSKIIFAARICFHSAVYVPAFNADLSKLKKKTYKPPGLSQTQLQKSLEKYQKIPKSMAVQYKKRSANDTCKKQNQISCAK